MLESGDFKAGEISYATAEAHGLGLFVRSMIGMDRIAATDALSTLQRGLNSNRQPARLR
jgi:type I restriction enzyme R subunit